MSCDGNSRAPPAARERGFALLVVIWVLALMAVLATGFASDTRSEARQARNLLEAARAQAMAEAGITLAVVGLLDQNPATQWSVDGSRRIVSYDGGMLAITVQDEAGKVNLNAAPLELIGNLLAALGVESIDRGAIIEAISARRRAAGTTLQIGAAALSGESDDAGPAALRNVAFRSSDELRSVPGLSGRTFERFAPFVTVFSRTPRINPLAASRVVLLALPNVNAQEVETLLSARAAMASGQSSVPVPLLSGVDRYAGRTTFRAAGIVATATTESGAVFTRQAVVSLTGKPDHPYAVLDWRQVLPAADRE